jgi:hypothetical protein
MEGSCALRQDDAVPHYSSVDTLAAVSGALAAAAPDVVTATGLDRLTDIAISWCLFLWV